MLWDPFLYCINDSIQGNSETGNKVFVLPSKVAINTLEVGYIRDGKVKWCQVTNSISNNIQFMFEDEGNYYICVRNASSDRIIITNGSIQEKKIQEE